MQAFSWADSDLCMQMCLSGSKGISVSTLDVICSTDDLICSNDILQAQAQLVQRMITRDGRPADTDRHQMYACNIQFGVKQSLLLYPGTYGVGRH